MKNIPPEIKLKIISLSACFWFWRSYYTFYASIIGKSARELENRFPRNSYNKYEVTEIILEELEKDSNHDIIKNIYSAFYRLKAPFDREDNPNYDSAKDLLKEFRDLIGKDVVEEEIKRKRFEEDLKLKRKEDLVEKESKEQIKNIKNDFLKYFNVINQKDKQERGYWLEKIFYQILNLEKIEFTKPYKTETEQIDGKFRFRSFDYLVEIKWTEDKVKQKDISIFDGKLKRKAQSNRGCILSIAGFDESAVLAASGNNPNLIFIDGNEIFNVLDDRIKMYDLIFLKEENLSRYGKVYK